MDKTSIEPRRLVKRTVEAIAGMAVTVLIVEDDDANRLVLRQHLGEQGVQCLASLSRAESG